MNRLGVSIAASSLALLLGCGSSEPLASFECPNDGSVLVADVYGNTIEYGNGPWGARLENTYVLDFTDGIIYIVPYDEVDINGGGLRTDRVSLYTADQNTGDRGVYTRTDGLSGAPNLLDHLVVFFSTFGAASTYIANSGMCSS